MNVSGLLSNPEFVSVLCYAKNPYSRNVSGKVSKPREKMCHPKREPQLLAMNYNRKVIHQRLMCYQKRVTQFGKT